MHKALQVCNFRILHCFLGFLRFMGDYADLRSRGTGCVWGLHGSLLGLGRRSLVVGDSDGVLGWALLWVGWLV